MRIRRDIPTGNGVEARESFWTRAPKAAVLRPGSSLSPSAGAVSPGEEWSRPKLGRRPARVGVGEFTVPPELADTQPHSSFRFVRFAEARALVETWLILPVVICLSQRLSHACLSISFYMAKLRMAH